VNSEKEIVVSCLEIKSCILTIFNRLLQFINQKELIIENTPLEEVIDDVRLAVVVGLKIPNDSIRQLSCEALSELLPHIRYKTNL
jgi:hypothetical protein